VRRTRRILFPSDFSKGAKPAFAQALELAQALKAELLIVHAVAPVVPVEALYAPIADWDALSKKIQGAAQQELDRLAALARRRRVEVDTLLTSGYAAEEILRVARARKASLIVMGTHGRTGLSRLMVGSVATRVMMSAPCAVMTVRQK
jgi:nucleotide-binding universal stress UspA family protein